MPGHDVSYSSSAGVPVTFTPTLTASTTPPTLGTGSAANATYMRMGNLVLFRFGIVFGSSGASPGSGDYYIASPFPMTNENQRFVGSLFVFQSGTAKLGLCDLDTVNDRVYFWCDTNTTRVSNATPATFGNNHQIQGDCFFIAEPS